MATQNSIIGYAPQPYFIDQPGWSSQCTVDVVSGSVENEAGIFDPDLSNYTTIIPPSGTNGFYADIYFSKDDVHLVNESMMVGLIGCSLKTYEDDGGGPDYDTEFEEDIVCSIKTSSVLATDIWHVGYAHNSNNELKRFCGTSMPGIISGGTSNLIIPECGKAKGSGNQGAVTVELWRLSANVTARPHAYFTIGHLFIGVEVPIVIDPTTFSWKMGLKNARFFSRDEGAISSDGTLIRSATGQIIKIINENIIGSEVTAISPSGAGFDIPSAVTYSANFIDLSKVNNSYPIVLNPYPYSAQANIITVEGFNLTARQNFFSIYGFLDNAFEFTPGEYRDGLNSEYKARFRIQETR